MKSYCDADNKNHIDISIKMRIELRNTRLYTVIENKDGKRILTKVGRGIYGHEQLPMQDYITQIQKLIDDIMEHANDGVDSTNCKTRAAETERKVKKAITEFVDARKPGGKGPDLTHGRPGQPSPGQPHDPDGEPGSYLPPAQK